MHEGAAWAVSRSALAEKNVADGRRVEDLIDDALATGGYTPHGLSTRAQHCLYGGRTIFGPIHGRARREASR
jgi:hypothetical protein